MLGAARPLIKQRRGKALLTGPGIANQSRFAPPEKPEIAGPILSDGQKQPSDHRGKRGTPYALPCGFYGVNTDSYTAGHVRQNDASASGTGYLSFNYGLSGT